MSEQSNAVVSAARVDPNHPLRATFWLRVEVRGPNDCWEWQGAKANGYGRFSVHAVKYPAHRLAWEFFNRQKMDEAHACHRCDNPGCCNPKHIFPGSHSDNARDAARKGRYLTRKPNAFCQRGHAMEGDNVYITPSTGKRRCRQCKIERNRAYRVLEGAGRDAG